MSATAQSISSISVVIPVYNSDQVLPMLIDSLKVVLESNFTSFELILVNDGSPDDSWLTIQDLANKNPWIKGINLMRNYGQHNALLCGIREATYEVIVTMDDDLQNPPEEIPKLLRKLSEGYSVVYGAPDEEQRGFSRGAVGKLSKLAMQIAMGIELASKISAFRAFRTEIRKSFESYRSPFVSIDVLLTWGTKAITYVTVRHSPRLIGKSNYTFRKLVTHSFNVLLGLSTVPLRLASLVGFVFTLFGLLVLTYVIVRYLFQGDSVPGFPFLASIIAIFSGAQLFALGILGEYISRIYALTLDRPPYVIKDRHEE
jgi:undecaprenyl-phosphate 4-deoxy-4-formamido-L-arabinose transferase